MQLKIQNRKCERFMGVVLAQMNLTENGWFQVKSSTSENPQKMEFALFWCKGTPWGVIQESQIFFRSDPYFGFYGGLKF